MIDLDALRALAVSVTAATLTVGTALFRLLPASPGWRAPLHLSRLSPSCLITPLVPPAPAVVTRAAASEDEQEYVEWVLATAGSKRSLAVAFPQGVVQIEGVQDDPAARWAGASMRARRPRPHCTNHGVFAFHVPSLSCPP